MVRLSLEHPDNSATSHPDSGVTFVNAKLFRIIVLTCNESTNELVVSSLKLGTGTAIDTIGAVPNGLDLEDADLCDLGGASFGDLDAGEYTLHATVPKD